MGEETFYASPYYYAILCYSLLQRKNLSLRYKMDPIEWTLKKVPSIGSISTDSLFFDRFFNPINTSNDTLSLFSSCFCVFKYF